MITIFLKNLQKETKGISEKRKKALTPKKKELYFLMECKKFLMLLKVEYFKKENKEKGLQVFQIRCLTISSSKY